MKLEFYRTLSYDYDKFINHDLPSFSMIEKLIATGLQSNRRSLKWTDAQSSFKFIKNLIKR